VLRDLMTFTDAVTIPRTPDGTCVFRTVVLAAQRSNPAAFPARRKLPQAHAGSTRATTGYVSRRALLITPGTVKREETTR
jgi:hypothetical protein